MDWYSVYHCYSGHRHIDFYRLHGKYSKKFCMLCKAFLVLIDNAGSIVRYGPHRITINTTTALRDIYHVRANVQKSQFFGMFSHFFKVPMSMTTIDRKAHAFKRRVDAEALTLTAIQNLEPIVLKNIRLFYQKMLDEQANNTKASWNKARNLLEWTRYIMTDIIGDITFHQN